MPKKGYGFEVDLCARAQRAGFSLVYDPSIVAYHTIPLERQTLSYTFANWFWVGAANALIRRPVNRQAVATLHPLRMVANLVVAAGRLYARVRAALQRDSRK